MTNDCTDLFLRYRDINRLVWNLGFWACPPLREWVCERSFTAAMARIFEGVVLRPFGCDAVIGETLIPGNYVHIAVEPRTTETELLVDGDPALGRTGCWGNPTVRAKQEEIGMRFIELFDWYSLGARDSHMIVVTLERFGSHPELVGRRALVEVMNCRLILVQED